MAIAVVGRYLGLPEALAVSCALQSAGIPTWIFDENIGRMYWQHFVGGVRVVVPLSEIEPACAYLRAVRSEAASF
jgi:hypothetical protein